MSGRAPRFSRDRPFSFLPPLKFSTPWVFHHTHKPSSYFRAFTILLYGSTRGENEKVGPKEKKRRERRRPRRPASGEGRLRPPSKKRMIG